MTNRFGQYRDGSALTFLCSVLAICSVSHAEEATTSASLAAAYVESIQPLLKRYCFECHSGDRIEAEIDLEPFSTLNDVRLATPVWLKVREMLESAQMPPNDAAQMSDHDRSALRHWLRAHLTHEAQARAGDPGAIMLRRLSNAEYNYTIRDLTHIDSLDPTREFPVDGAAGEGFTNTGSALVMSPSLVQKYLDAAKSIADHAVLLPDGIRYSAATTRRDWTDEWLARIQAFYLQFSDNRGGSKVNLQGIEFDTNQGGRLPVERYLAATLQERDALRQGTRSLDIVARERALNAKYLRTLWDVLNAPTDAKPQSLVDRLRVQWQQAGPNDAERLAADISTWQQVLWKFNSVGHIGREGSPARWMEPTSLIAHEYPVHLPLPDVPAGSSTTITLAAGDAHDGSDDDYVVWKQPRLEGPNLPTILLRDLVGYQERVAEIRAAMLSRTARYLSAAAKARDPQRALEKIAATEDVDVQLLRQWVDYLQIGSAGEVAVTGHLTSTMQRIESHEFINGWGASETPLVVANASDQEVRIPGDVKPHSIVVHPSPTQFVAVGWRSPLQGTIRVEAQIQHAHPGCGNGVEWFVQYRTQRQTGNLAQGVTNVGGTGQLAPVEMEIHPGELLSIVISARGADHGCDLTNVQLVIHEIGGEQRSWDLAHDVSSDILRANPRDDHYQHQAIWHFYAGEAQSIDRHPLHPRAIPPESLLGRWLTARDDVARYVLARTIQELVNGDEPTPSDSPDAIVYRQIKAMAIPADHSQLAGNLRADVRFGRQATGGEVDAADLVMKAPAALEFTIPEELARGRTLVATGQLEPERGSEGSVQLQAVLGNTSAIAFSASQPILVAAESRARKRLESSLQAFRDLFPAALCYTRIVPVDEVVTLMLYYREDDVLQRLMLDADQITALNRLWDELFYLAQEPLQSMVAFEQISEFATQDRPDLVEAFKSLRGPLEQRVAAYRERLIATEPAHLDATLHFAEQAWRRRLTEHETASLRQFYQRLRAAEIPHDSAIRQTIARVLTSPTFLYRHETPPDTATAQPVTANELANRLSYFLWSSLPDDELLGAANDRERPLTRDDVLLAQTHRLLADARTQRLAIQFACQWLHVRDFDQNNEKNERLYPEFAELRHDMYQETVRFFESMFRENGSILDILQADHTFLNESLAKHYGVANVNGAEWRRVDGLRAQGRGGILGMATVLASQSGASRTSPILRGNWVSETILGEKLPRPPANVPQLPEEVPTGLTERQLIEHHSSTPACAKCHARIDPYGFALEQFDTIGRVRPQTMDTKTRLLTSKEIEGLGGLRDYLLVDRRDDVVHQFCRKLLGYALGREVQLSDELLLAEMQTKLEANNYRFHTAVETIVTSKQFREIRGRSTPAD